MAENREERFLMRQRGAGARQLRNSGFDFDLPGLRKSPLKSTAPEKSRRTPRSGPKARASTKRTPRRSTRRTPASRRTQDPKTSPAQQLASISEQRDAPTSQATKVDEPGTVTKKRKLVGRPRKASLSVYGESQGAASIFGTMLEKSEPINSSALKQIVESEPPTTAPGKKRKKRMSVGQRPKKRARTSLPEDSEPASEPSGKTLAHSGPEQRQPDWPELEANQAQVSPVAVQPESAKRKRRKRKPFGAPPKKRKSLDVVTSSSLNVGVGSGKSLSTPQQEVTVKKPRKTRTALASVHEPENEIAEEAPTSTNRTKVQPSSNIPSSSTQPRRRGRPRKSQTSILKSTTEKVPKASTSKPRTNKPSAKAHPSSSIADPSETRQSKQKTSTIPITEHRISRTKHLNHDPTEEDVLSAPPPYPSKSGVNATDVLSQICRKMVAKSIKTFKENTDPEPDQRQNAECGRRTKVVEMFGEELNARLLQMSEAIDHKHGLTTRLRQATKPKTGKRAALLEIKRQREKIAMEMGVARAQHEVPTKAAQDENDLDTMIHDIKLAVQRGRAAQLAQGAEGETEEESGGLELRLRMVAAEGSSVGGGACWTG